MQKYFTSFYSDYYVMPSSSCGNDIMLSYFFCISFYIKFAKGYVTIRNLFHHTADKPFSCITAAPPFSIRRIECNYIEYIWRHLHFMDGMQREKVSFKRNELNLLICICCVEDLHLFECCNIIIRMARKKFLEKFNHTVAIYIDVLQHIKTPGACTISHDL